MNSVTKFATFLSSNSLFLDHSLTPRLKNSHKDKGIDQPPKTPKDLFKEDIVGISAEKEDQTH